MPSKVVSKILGEAKPPPPSDLFNKSYPNQGDGSALKWRLHRIVGVTPVSVDREDFELWLEQLAEANVDGELPSNHIQAADLPGLIQATHHTPLREFLVEVEQVVRHTGADEVAFTTDL